MSDPAKEIVDKILSTTDDAERNRLAIALGGIGSPMARAALLDLSRRPGLINVRGTIINALSNFDNSDIFDYLIDLVIEGNWEVAHEAFLLIEKIEYIESERARLSYEKLTNLAHFSEKDGWRQDLIADLKSLFD